MEELENPGFEKRIRKAMRRTLYTRIFKALGIVALALTVGVLGTGWVMDVANYSPAGENIDTLMNVYLATCYPGTVSFVYWGEDREAFERKGFGRYEMDVLVQSSFDPLWIGREPGYPFTITRSRLDTDRAPLYRRVREFTEPGAEPEETTRQLQDPALAAEELTKLPESAMLDVSLSLDRYLTAEETAELMAAWPGVEFRWLALRGQEVAPVNGIAGGMYLQLIAPAEGDPAMELPFEGITGQMLRSALVSRLELMTEHPEFLKMMQSRTGIPAESWTRALENARQDWACYGLRITAGREDLEQLLKQLPVTGASVNDVKLSRYEK